MDSLIIYNSENISKRQNFNCNFNFKKICCGDDFFIAIDYNGKIYSWGCGLRFRLGYNMDSNDILRKQKMPLLISYFQNMKVVSVSCGNDFGLALIGNKYKFIDYKKDSGEVYSWGENHSGQLG